MTVSLQITFRNMEPSPAVEARIGELAERLERFEHDIQHCHVTVEAPHRHHRHGRLYRVGVEVTVPRGDIVATRERPQTHAHEDLYVAMRDAFDAIVRQLEDHVRSLRGQTKHHETPLQRGRVRQFVGDHGFIETAEGQEVYFHRNSVARRAFDRLQVGDEVRLSVVEGEKGWQAATVQPLGEHRRTG